jgi:hypothetical protein
MRFFSNLFGQAKELTKLGNAVANIRKMLDEYEDDKDPFYLVVPSWICKVGVVDMIQKNGWLPNYVVYVPINGHQTKMSMEEVLEASVGRLMNKVKGLGNVSFEEKINDILHGGPSFYEIDSELPQKMKDIIDHH